MCIGDRGKADPGLDDDLRRRLGCALGLEFQPLAGLVGRRLDHGGLGHAGVDRDPGPACGPGLGGLGGPSPRHT